jgi:mRNA-degrading endonuclease RelE of RelBE toxin-antitoxin system
MKILLSAKSKKDLKKLGKKHASIAQDLQNTLRAMLSGEVTADKLQNVGELPIYKLRVKLSDSNKGKSAGARVIYYYAINEDSILVITIYVKVDKTGISRKEIDAILANTGFKLKK